MRTLSLLSLAAVSLVASAAAASQEADACGMYMMSPAVFRIVSAPRTNRAFVMSARDATKADDFELLQPESYDPTEIAPHAPLPRAISLTLLGEHASRKVSTDRTALVRNNWLTQGQMLGLEVPMPATERRDFAIAVAGNHRDLAWKPLHDEREAGTDDRAFLAANKIDTKDAVVLRTPLRDKLVALFYFDAAIGDYRIALRDGDAVAGAFVGHPLGVLAADGMSHLVVDNKGLAHAYMI